MENKKRKLLTLTIIHQHESVLLGIKKRGFGAGRWNGFGGKVASGETIEEAAKRELQEEAGLEAEELEKIGVIEFEFRGDPELLEVHIFVVERFFGEPVESEEMRPQWFAAEQIPYEAMWPDDRYWLPLLLSKKKFRARFLFRDPNAILEYDIKEVEAI